MRLLRWYKDDYIQLPIKGDGDEDQRSIDYQSRHKCSTVKILTYSVVFLLAFYSVYIALTAAKEWSQLERSHVSTEVDLESLLASLTPVNISKGFQTHHKDGKAITTSSPNIRVLGAGVNRISMPYSNMSLPTDAKKETRGTPFNLGLMRLPLGSKWEYLAVARGPMCTHSSEKVNGLSDSAEVSNVLGWGMNMTEDGQLIQVSKATFLYIRTIVTLTCKIPSWNRLTGPEDARMYWSDIGTPMINLGIPSSVGGCRGMAMIQDVRSVWPELVEALQGTKVEPFVAGKPEMEMMEITKEGQGIYEKNWMALFPGPVPNKNSTSTMPHIMYKPFEGIKLAPPAISTLDTSSALPVFQYQEIPTRDSHPGCINAVNPEGKKDKVQHHSATPSYRLTLCNRGECQPNENNTYFLSMTHLVFKTEEHFYMYDRYFTLRSVDSTFDLVAVGSLFMFNSTQEIWITYSTSLTFIPQSKKQEIQTAHLGPTHGFLDDTVLVGVGMLDGEIATIKLDLQREILADMKMCNASMSG